MGHTVLRAALLLGGTTSAAPLSPQVTLSPQATRETEGELRFADQKLELRFSRGTGRRLALYDLSNHLPVTNEGQHLASVVITTARRTPFASGGEFQRPPTDTRSAGLQLKPVNWREQKSGDMVRLTLETEEGCRRIQQVYGMKPRGDMRRVEEAAEKGETEK